MSETSFSQVNTAISVQEASFLTPQQYDQLLQADDAASRSALLQGTVYAMDAEAIKDLNAIEQVLMKHLYSVYNWALEISPSKELDFHAPLHLPQSQSFSQGSGDRSVLGAFADAGGDLFAGGFGALGHGLFG